MKLAHCCVLSLFVFGACGGNKNTGPDASPDAHVGPDAPPPDAQTPFGCLGVPLPTTAPAMITISGTTEEIKNLAAQPLSGTMVQAFDGSGTSLATGTAASDGTYSLTLSTGGTPVDGYVVGHHANAGTTTYIDDYLYPPHAMVSDHAGGVILMLTPNTLGLISGVLQVTQDPSKGMLGLVVADCNGNTLAGATVTTEPAATAYYDSGSLPSTTAKATDTDGRAYILNLPPGPVTVHATLNTMILRSHTLTVRPGVVTTTAVEP
jgi:hypothetical protein